VINLDQEGKVKMQIGNLDVNQAIEAAKKRLNASIYGHKKMPIKIHSGNVGCKTKITVGEYEIDGIAFIDISMKPGYEHNMISMGIYADSVQINGHQSQGTSRK
jgi:hypothetical protein